MNLAHKTTIVLSVSRNFFGRHIMRRLNHNKCHTRRVNDVNKDDQILARGTSSTSFDFRSKFQH